MRLNWLFRAVVVVAAVAPGLLGLQVALGTAARWPGQADRSFSGASTPA